MCSYIKQSEQVSTEAMVFKPGDLTLKAVPTPTCQSS